MNLCVLRDYIENCKKYGECPTWDGLKRFCGGNKDG